MRGQPAPTAGRYGTCIAVMMEMGWSWGELQEAPADMVQELIEHLNWREHWTQKRRQFDKQMSQL